MPLASSRILGADERIALGYGTNTVPVWALMDENGEVIAYVRRGDGTGRPGYGSMRRADDPGVQGAGPYRHWPNAVSVHLDSLPILGLRDSSD